jgi:hypothetical protein
MSANTRQNLGGLLLLLMVTLGFYWRLTLTDEYIWFDHPDMAYLELPRLAFEAREIHAGRFPLWDSQLWSGQPLIGLTQPGPLYPFNVLFCLLPLDQGYLSFRWLNWYWVFIHFQAAVAAWWLARELERSRKAAFFAACIFAFGGFVGSVAWLDVINGAVWTPLVLLFALRAMRGPRPWGNAALGGLALGVAWLSGHHELPLLTTYAMGFLWLYAALRAGPSRLRVAAHGAAFFSVAFLTAAAQLLPAVEFGRLSLRWTGVHEPTGWNDVIPYTIDTVYSVPWRSLPGLIVKAATIADASLYAGLVCVALASLGILAFWGDRRVRLLVALGGAALVFALGAATPLHGLFYSLAPLVGKARVPARAIHLVHLALAMLAAYGVDALLEGAAERWRVRLERVLAGAGALFVGLALTARLPFNELLRDGLVLAGVAALALAVAAALARRGMLRGAALAAALVALSLMELSPLAQFSSRHSPGGWHFAKVLLERRDIAGYLRALPEPVRVVKDDQTVPENFGEWHGLDMLLGYSAGVTINQHRMPFWTPRAQSILSVTHWLGREPDRPEQVLAFEGASGVNIYINPGALPRVRVVHETVRAATPDELSRMIAEPGIDLRRTAILSGPAPALETCPGEDEAWISERTSDRWRVGARLGCRGMLVVANTYYPGWIASVDGVRQPVLEVYGALQGVVVEPGLHDVRLEYRPRSFYAGLGLSALGLLIAGGAWLSRR